MDLTIRPDMKFCPMFPPLPMQGALGKVQLQFIPCLEEKCMMYQNKACTLALKKIEVKPS
jgi:hypothetical protein